MNSIYLLVIAVLGILFTVFIRHRNDSSRLKSLRKRHAIQNPEIDFEYNRFNTKKERNTSISIEGERFHLLTDIQNITIADQTFVSKISSEYDTIPIVFDIVIQPFEKVLFEFEGFENFDQDGLLILWSYGVHTKFPIEQIEELDFLLDIIPTKPRGVYLGLESYKVHKSENSVILNGKFEDGEVFKLQINYKTDILEFSAPIASIKNIENFKNIDELDKKET